MSSNMDKIYGVEIRQAIKKVCKRIKKKKLQTTRTLGQWDMEMNKPTYVDFEKDKYPWKPDIDYRENPHLYKIGRD